MWCCLNIMFSNSSAIHQIFVKTFCSKLQMSISWQCQRKSQGITKVSRLYRISLSVKFHDHPSNSWQTDIANCGTSLKKLRLIKFEYSNSSYYLQCKGIEE